MEGTAYANRVIELQLAPQKPAFVPVPLASLPPPPPPGPVSPGPEAGRKMCFEHKQATTSETCFFCRKALCPGCLLKFGYFCSLTCRKKAEARGDDIPVYALQESVVLAKKMRRVKLIGGLVGILLLAGIGIWGWYVFVGSKPAVVFSLKLPVGTDVQFCEFVDSDRIVLVDQKKIASYHVKSGRELWTKPLEAFQPPKKKDRITLKALEAQVEQVTDPVEREILETWVEHKVIERRLTELKNAGADGPGGILTKINEMGERLSHSKDESVKKVMGSIDLLEMDPDDDGVDVLRNGGGLWVRTGQKLLCLDLKTGLEKVKQEIEGRIQKIVKSDEAIIIVSKKDGAFFVTRVDAVTGDVQSQGVNLGEPVYKVDPGPELPPSGYDFSEVASIPHKPDILMSARDVFPSVDGAVEVDARISLEQVGEQHVEAKPAAGPSVLDNPNVGVLNAADLVDEMKSQAANRGPGTVYRDESRYLVQVRHLFSPDEPPMWRAELGGVPHMYPGRTLDILVGGKNLIVFDRKGQKLWEAQLVQPFSVGWDQKLKPPFMETEDTLYFPDGNVLTAYDKKNGNVRWRLPGVVLEHMEMDRAGYLYLFQQPATRAGHTLLVWKVDPGVGHVLWKFDRTNSEGMISGKFLYLYFAHTSSIDMLGKILNAGVSEAGDVPVHFKLWRFDTQKGELLWEHYQKRGPRHVEARDNKILILFEDEIQVLRFYSF